MKKLIALTLSVLMLCLLLAGCGGSKVDISGKYGATACTSVETGESMPLDGDFIRIFTDGSGYISYVGSEYDFTWTLKGSDFTFTDVDGDSFEGSYHDGVIRGTYAGYQYTFELNAEAAEAAEAAETDSTTADTASAEPAAQSGTADAKAAAQNSDASDEASGPADASAETAAQPAGAFTPVTGTIDGYEYSIVGAEAIEDSDGSEAIRFYYTFTNTGDEPTSAWWNASSVATQAGFELVGAYVWEDVPEYGNANLEVYPGVTILCEDIYDCQYSAGTITYRLYDSWTEEEVIAEFDPQNLPGRPDADACTAALDLTGPYLTEGLELAGVIDDDCYVSLDSYEIVPGWDDGEYVMRIYYTFTNNGSDENSFFMATYYNCYQDGIELDDDWADESIDSDENGIVEVQPGESIEVTECFTLRNLDDPVETIVYDYNDVEYGCYVDIAGFVIE